MEKKRMMHVGLVAGEIGEYVFLPGSPERSRKIATYLDDAREMAYNREFLTFTGKLEGVPVSVCSTGMGCPSTAIAVEELFQLGAHTMIRVGSCASTSPKVKVGDIVIPNGAVRMEGVAQHYLPIEFPPVPDMELVKKLVDATIKRDYPYNVGVSITKASFHTQTDAASKPMGYELANRWNAYEMGGATSTDMESATLFVVGACLKIRVATVLVSATNYKEYSADSQFGSSADWEHRAIEVGIDAMRAIIKEDNEKTKQF